MAQDSIDIKLKVSDNGGTKKLTEDAKEYNKELTDIQKKASNLYSKGMGRGVASGYQGMHDNGPDSYSTARGAVGTGAAGRDFAKQSQGLGGLVRLYATYAANLFAVSAAFRALSDAMDTANMVRGLDQLGIASGTNLTKMSKGLVEATDGAITLREAMQATAQAAAAGMSDANIKRLGTAARATSAALGIGMSDAISRLSRGITKLEPELLDELGIFTRVDKASEDYARKIGKTAATLTDFEKRQAFANAVLDEANQKFGSINIPANPYDKLVASLQNLSTTALGTVNTILGPLIEALSRSPTALTTIIAGLSALLISKAIPAISHWRDELRDASEHMADKAKTNFQLYQDYLSSNLDQAEKRLSAHQRLLGDSAKKGIAAALDAVKKAAPVYSKEFSALLKKDPSEFTTADINTVKKYEADAKARAAKFSEDDEGKKAVNARARRDAIAAVSTELQKQIGIIDAHNAAIKQEAAGSTLMDTIHKKLAINADNAAKKMQVLANAADNATFVGPVQAFRVMWMESGKLTDSVGRLGVAMLRLKGTMTIIASTVGMVASAFGNVLSAVGLVTTAFSLATSLFGKNAKEAQQASKSVGDLSDNVFFLNQVVDNLSKKDPLQQLNTNNLAARSRAMDSVAKDMVKAIDDVDKEIAARGTVDKFTNWVYGWFNKSTEDQLTKQLVTGITNSINAADATLQGSALRLDLAKVLGISATSSAEDFGKAMGRASDATKKLAAASLDKFTTKLDGIAGSAKALASTLQETYKAYDDFIKSSANQSAESKLALQSIKDFTELNKVLTEGTEPALDAIAKYSKDPKFLRMFSGSNAADIRSFNVLADNLQQSLAAVNSELVAQNSELDRKNKLLKDTYATRPISGENVKIRSEIIKQLTEGIDEGQKKLSTLEINRTNLAKQIGSLADEFKKLVDKGISDQIDVLYKQISTAQQKAAVTLQKAYSQPLSDTRAGVQLQLDLDKKAIDIDTEQLKASLRLIEAEVDNTLATQAMTAAFTLAELERQKDNLGGNVADRAVRANLEQKIAAENKKLQDISTINTNRSTSGSISSISASTLKNMSPELKSVLTPVLSQAAATQSAIISKDNEKYVAEFNASLKELNIIQKNADTSLTSDIQGLTDQIAKYSSIVDPIERENKIAPLKQDLLEKQKQKAMLPYDFQITAAAMAASKLAGNEKAKEGLAEESAKRTAAEAAYDAHAKSTLEMEKQKTVSESIAYTFAQEKTALDNSAKLQEISYATSKQNLDIQTQNLEIAYQKGQIDDNAYVAKKKELALANQLIDSQKALNDLAEAKQSATLPLRQKLKDLESKPLDQQDVTEISRTKELLKSTEEYYNSKYNLQLRDNDSKKQAIQLTMDESGRLSSYTAAFQSAFKGMEDAIVEFTKTGKLSFSGMINSFLEDLLRYEIRQQQAMMFQGMGGASGMASSLMGFLGFGSGPVGPSPSAPALPSSFDQYLAQAKGGVYDAGLQMFAKGGAFTNSVVNSPTLFKFAQGTGLMGEAGPEAIMPLKRDASGTLGVQATSSAPKVDIVVNNHSGAPATTKETTDSRGNRRVEVLIGDMVSSEMSRPGSSTRDAMRTNYGMQPALVRR